MMKKSQISVSVFHQKPTIKIKMSAIFSRLIRVSFTNFATTLQRPSSSSSSSGFSQSHSRHFFLHHLHHVKWFHFHDLPGIPNDGKVVRLRNSTTGSELYLVGTVHISPESAETVRKVINSVRPDVVAVELCRRRAMALQNWKPENDSLYRMCLNSMRAPGGIRMKICMFILNLWYRQLRADGIIPGQEFKVAMEQSLRVKARCFAIDQDFGILLQQLSKILSFDTLKRSFIRAWDRSTKLEQLFSHYTSYNDFNRSSVREITCFLSKISPEIVQVLIEDRDKLMFARLRRMEEKVIVAVVGLGHMDGIEHLWKLAEGDDDK